MLPDPQLLSALIDMQKELETTCTKRNSGFTTEANASYCNPAAPTLLDITLRIVKSEYYCAYHNGRVQILSDESAFVPRSYDQLLKLAIAETEESPNLDFEHPTNFIVFILESMIRQDNIIYAENNRVLARIPKDD